MASEEACSVCSRGVLQPFLKVGDMPVHVGVLWREAESARTCPQGPMTLAVCDACGWVYNVDFDDGLIDYSQKYDNALHVSKLFQDFEHRLAAHLMSRYALQGGTVAEIGCGSGHFLGLLTGMVEGRGFGFDPSHDPDDIDPLARENVKFVRGEYSRVADLPQIDLLACRQTLEHIPNPAVFLRDLQRALKGSDTVVYFEVPNSTMAFRNLSIWDLVYEHCTYFAELSLRFLFESTGFEVLDIRETYGGQFLSLEARPMQITCSPSLPVADALRSWVNLTTAFAEQFTERRRRWQDKLQVLREEQKRVVVWGGGARAVSFFNLLDTGPELRAVVDINPGKQGTFLAGSGQPIIPPEELAAIEPDLVIVLNDLYRDEITHALHELRLFPEVVAA
jgi:SAM-dependent methyltransferase